MIYFSDVEFIDGRIMHQTTNIALEEPESMMVETKGRKVVVNLDYGEKPGFKVRCTNLDTGENPPHWW